VSRDVTLYVDDMIEACQRVAQYSAGLDRDGLNAGTMITDAIVRISRSSERRPRAFLLMSELASQIFRGVASQVCGMCSATLTSPSTWTSSGT
jgi:hypothetical protein